MDTFDLMPLLEKINVPTLICHSTDDRVVQILEGRAFASLIPGADLIEWENPDHMWSFAPNWREAQNDIIEFLTGERPGSGARKQIACVLFTDIVDSTKRASELGDSDWRKVIELHDSISKLRVSAHDGTTVKNTGDGTLATFPDPGSAVSAALELTRDLAASGIPIRAGLHIGQIEVHDGGDVTGIAVNIAARVQALANGGEILVSQTVRDMLLGSAVNMNDRGEHHLKGVDGVWHVYAVST
jgi:class 3 adenylate cyclase